MKFTRIIAFSVIFAVLFSSYTAFAKESHFHTFDSETTEPTCTQDGKIAYTCIECGYSYEEVLPANGHTFVTYNTKSTYFSEGVNGKVACKDCGLVLNSGDEIAKKTLKTPKIKKIKTVDIDAVKITWKKVKNADGYYVYRKKGKTFKKIATVENNKYKDTGLAIGKKYKYKVKAYIKDDGKTATGKTDAKVYKISVNACKKYEIDRNHYAFPIANREKVNVSSLYGWRWGSFHAGVDLSAHTGEDIVAWKDGYVYKSGYHSSWGNYIMIYHGKINGKDVYSGYAHLSRRSVKKGQKVVQGQKIGDAGNTGRSYGTHLHFEIYYGGKSAKKPPRVKSADRINPVYFIGLKNHKGIQSVK